MPPLYDDIGDALELPSDGVQDTVSLDCAGATFENDEATNGEGWEGVWVKIDLSAPQAGSPFNIDLELLKTGGDAGFEPYMDFMRVVDATFDPGNPDFSKLDFVSGQYVGDGTSNPTSTITLEAGTGTAAGDRSITGVYYGIFTDWNFVGYGQADFTYTVPEIAGIVCIDAVDIIHPSSTTTVITSGRVREDFEPLADGQTPPEWSPETFQFNPGDHGLDGKYEMRVKGTWTGTANGGELRVLAKRNGRSLMGIDQPVLAFGDGKPFDRYQYYLNPTGSPQHLVGRGPYVAMKPGDTIDLTVWSTLYNGATFVPAEIESICFEYVGAFTPVETADVTFETLPLGFATWNDPGIQALGFVNSGNADFCVMPNGDVYAAFIDLDGPQSSTPPSIWFHYGEVWKYDAGTDTWSTLLSPFTIAAAGSRTPSGGVTIETDGEDVYLAWWEWDGTYWSGGPNTTYPGQKRYEWHLKKYDVSGNSWSELGTGQRAYDITTSTGNVDPFSMLAICFNAGTLYVAADELTNTSPRRREGQIWEWDGSAWNDISPADPTLDYTTWEITGGAWYNVVRAVSMCSTPDGLLGVYYSYEDSTGGGAPFQRYGRYLEWDGSSWVTDSRFEAADIMAGRLYGGTGGASTVFVAYSLASDGTDVWLATDVQDFSWDVLRLSDDKTTFETVTDYSGNMMVRPSQSGNDATVGSDGRVYRHVASFEFDHFYVVAKDVEADMGGWQTPSAGNPIGFDAPDTNATRSASQFFRIRANGDNLYVMMKANVYDPANSIDEFVLHIVKGTIVPAGGFVPHIYRLVMDS